MSLTKRTTNATPPVAPSSRDAIESWLDVLTAMLSLPPSQRIHVRDELEDHLRSRVDDLLITGTPEPEAIRLAVAELGETAELAKTITAANRTPHSFRRFTMHALITIAAGSLIALGITANSTNGTTTLPQSSSRQLDAQASGQGADPFSAFTIDVRKSTIADLFQRVDENTDKPLIVHWGILADIGVEKDTAIGIDAEPLTAGLTLTILSERSERDIGDSIGVLDREDRIEIGTRSQFDRRTREKRIYDLSMFTEASPENVAVANRAQVFQARRASSMQNIIELLQSHISPDDWVALGGEYAMASVLNSTLVITAPERMHAQIESMLEGLEAQHEAQQREQRMRAEVALKQIREEYEAAKTKYLAKANEYGRMELLGQKIEQRMTNGGLSGEQFKQVQAEMGDLGLALNEQRLELEEQEHRFESLQALLLETESHQLRAQLSDR